jgi:hypothetical protein
VNQLNQEIAGLSELQGQLFLDLNNAFMDEKQRIFSKTWKGKLFQGLGYFFSVYCVYKIVMATLNILLNRNVDNRLDPATRIMQIASNHIFTVRIDVTYWSQQISFVLIMILVVMSVRRLLLNLHKVCIFGEFCIDK